MAMRRKIIELSFVDWPKFVLKCVTNILFTLNRVMQYADVRYKDSMMYNNFSIATGSKFLIDLSSYMYVMVGWYNRIICMYNGMTVYLI